jgi:predicted choloylglycine hydrolase
MEQNERTVVDGAQHQMYVRHLTMRGTNYEIGYSLGEIAMQRHGRHPDTHLRGDPRYVRARRHYIQQTYPILWERMRGVAAAYVLDAHDDRYDFSMLLYGVDLPQGADRQTMLPLGCSVVYYPPTVTASGSAYLSRNFDFSIGSVADIFGLPVADNAALEPMVRHPYVLELDPSDGGYASIAIHAYDLLSGTIDGMNEAGLVVSLMADEEAMAQIHEPHPGPVQAIGLHELQVMRYLLDICATAEEAKDALLLVKQHYQLMPCHYIIGDCHGNSFVYENSTGRNVQHIVDGQGQPQVVTNFQLHRHPSRQQMPGPAFSLDTNAFWRYRTLENLLYQHRGRFTEDAMKASNACVSMHEMFKLLGNDPADHRIAASMRTRTLWHSLYNLEERRVVFDFYLGETNNGTPIYEIRSGSIEFSLAIAPERKGTGESLC